MIILVQLLALIVIVESGAIAVQTWLLRDVRGTMRAHLELHDKRERRYADEE